MMTEAQWGAFLRWMFTLSLQPTGVRFKRIPGTTRFRFRGKLVVSHDEPQWWHRRGATRWGRRFRRLILQAASEE